MDKCKKTVWDMLSSISIKIHVDEQADFADRKYYDILNEGIKENNITKIYEFITAAERGGMRPHSSEVIGFFQEAYKEDPFRLCKFIADKDSLYDYWVFLDMVGDEMLLSFYAFEIENPLFFYECSRQILNRFCIENIDTDKIVRTIIKFANYDEALWKLWIKIQESNKKWETIVAYVLEHINDEGLWAYSDTISLNMTCHNNLLKIITESFKAISSEKVEHIFEIISPRIIERWELLVTENKSNKKFTNSTLICPYTNVILMCMEYSYNREQILEKIERYIDIIVCDDEKWYASESDYISNVNFNFTNVFYILMCNSDMVEILRENEKIKEYLKLLQSLLNKHTKAKRNENEDFKKVLELIEQVFAT